MRRTRLLGFTLALVAALQWPTPGHAAADGEGVFKGRCAGCHGADGRGKSAVGTPDFTSAKTQSGITDAEIVETITNGRKGTIMPAWKGKLTDEEIAAVAAHLRSLGRVASRDQARKFQ